MDAENWINISSSTKEIDPIDLLSFTNLGLKSIYQENEIIFEEVNKEVLKNEPITECDTDKKIKKTIDESDWAERPADHPIIYMKHLDSNICVGFSTTKGQKIFKKAIKKKYMNIYFTLAPHFHTQHETNFCAVGTLSMALNALQVDPRRMWKYPWRWYDEYMLNTCVSLDVMMGSGCDFDDFGCMLRCNKLSAEAVRVSKESSLKEFRNDVKLSSSSNDTVMLLNYSRGKFNQTGTGHFTPLGGYNKENDMVLILDTARFKFPPHWVSLELLWNALKDLAVGRQGTTDDMPRGYFLVKRNEESPSITLKFPGNHRLHFQPSNINVNQNVEFVVNISSRWDEWLNSSGNSEADILPKSINFLIEMSKSMQVLEKIEVTSTNSQQWLPLLSKIESTSLFQKVKFYLETLPRDEVTRLFTFFYNILNLFKSKKDFKRGLLNTLQDNKQQRGAKREVNQLKVVHYGLTILVLFWPYRATDIHNNRKTLENFVKNDLQMFRHDFVSTIHQQIRFLQKTLEHFGHEKIYHQEEFYFD